jgi:ubiquinone/menaquinone biosynthesis C-methylase UbiE
MTVQTPDQTRAAWDQIAAGYDQYVTPTNLELGADALRSVGLRPGMRVLDVAAGSGGLSLPAARRGAQVLAVDISPAMVARLEARARREGLTNLEARVMDGHALELEDDTFDLAGSQFGVMLFPDLPRGLRELTRVTRPGGRVLLVVMGPPPSVEFFAFFVRAIQAAVPGFTGPPSDPPPLPFQVADPDALRRALANAGLRDVRVETVAERVEFRSGDHLWDWVTNSNPLAGAILADLRLTDEQRTVIRQALGRLLRERSGGSDPAVLTNQVHIGVGRK